MTESELLKLLQTFVARFKTQREAAQAVGISQGYFNDILHGRRPPTDSVLAAIRVQRIVSYKRAKPAA